jgi:hypothetical protein
MGRVIFSQHLNGDLKFNTPFITDEVYITKIELNNGASVITKKIINKIRFDFQQITLKINENIYLFDH